MLHGYRGGSRFARAAARTLACLALAGLSAAAHAAAAVGQPAPALTVPRLDGASFDLGALRGKVVIVSFWATWCVPCREEMPALDAFYRQYRQRGVELIGLSVDRPHDRDDVLKVMHAFSYPAAVLKEAKSNGFGSPGVLPVTYIVDADGVVRAKLVPDAIAVTEKSLAQIVLPLLPQSAASPPVPPQSAASPPVPPQTAAAPAAR